MEKARFLMCPPEFYGVDYVINPWMQGKRGTVAHAEAVSQWQTLHTLLTETLGAQTEQVTPRQGLPDLVFTANAGLNRGSVVIPARFRHLERQGEEPIFREWFANAGYTLRELPTGIAFEGAGDALFYESETGDTLWAAHGFRTDEAAHPILAEKFDVEVVSLRLSDTRFYHLDTCFCPLPGRRPSPGGRLLWYPSAFDETSRRRVMERIAEADRYAVSESDALAFACNAVSWDNHVVLNAASPELTRWLADQGFTTYATPLTEFIKAGGSAKCLTLRLS